MCVPVCGSIQACDDCFGMSFIQSEGDTCERCLAKQGEIQEEYLTLAGQYGEMEFQLAPNTSPITASMLRALQDKIVTSYGIPPQFLNPSISQSGLPDAANHLSTSYNQPEARRTECYPVLSPQGSSRTPEQVEAVLTDPIILSQRAQGLFLLGATGASALALSQDDIQQGIGISPHWNHGRAGNPTFSPYPHDSAPGWLPPYLAPENIAPASTLAPYNSVWHATSTAQQQSPFTRPFESLVSAQAAGPSNPYPVNLPVKSSGPMQQETLTGSFESLVSAQAGSSSAYPVNLSVAPFTYTPTRQGLANYHQHTAPTLHSGSVAPTTEPPRWKGKGRASRQDLGDEPSNSRSPPAAMDSGYLYRNENAYEEQEDTLQTQLLSTAAGPSRAGANQRATTSRALPTSTPEGPAHQQKKDQKRHHKSRNRFQRCPAHRQKKYEEKDDQKPKHIPKNTINECRRCRLTLAASSLLSLQDRPQKRKNRKNEPSRTERPKTTIAEKVKRGKENDFLDILFDPARGLPYLQEHLDHELFVDLLLALEVHDGILPETWRPPATWIP